MAQCGRAGEGESRRQSWSGMSQLSVLVEKGLLSESEQSAGNCDTIVLQAKPRGGGGEYEHLALWFGNLSLS